MDQDNSLVFFTIDENVYDGAGRLISNALRAGTLEMLCIPVPGLCSRYFLVSSNEVASGATEYYVSVLDMAYVDPATCIHGRLAGQEELISDPGLAALADWGAEAFVPDQLAGKLPNPQGILKFGMGLLRAVPKQGSEEYFLYGIQKDKTFAYNVTATGISALVVSNGNSYVGYYPVGVPQGNKTFLRDADVTQAPNGNILLALTDCSLVPEPTPEINGKLMVLRFNGATGALITPRVYDPFPGLVVCDPTTSPTGVFGCAFNSTATSIFFTGLDPSPRLASIDLITEALTDYTALIPASVQDQRVHSRLYRNRASGSSANSVYVAHENGLSALEDIDGTPTWNDAVVFSAPVPQYVVQIPDMQYLPYFLNAQTRPPQAVPAESLACCKVRETRNAYCGYIHDNTNGSSWTATNNYFNDQAEVTFTGDVVIPAGTLLQVNGVTWHFAPEAKLVIERGGRLIVQNSLLTSLACEGLRWPGIRVEGNSANPTQANNPGLSPNGQQGRVSLTLNTVVENAVTGVWCARELDPFTADPNYYGGRVVALESTFRNCIVGARVEHYHNFSLITSQEIANASNFWNCTFETTSTWPDESVPQAHMLLVDVKGIRIVNSRFENQIPEEFSSIDQGWGIRSTFATFQCTGMDPALHYFRNLYVGAVAAAPAGVGVYTVDRMFFDNNQFGVYDLGSYDPVITNNTFKTLSSAVPLPTLSMGLCLHQTERYTVERNSFISYTTNVPSIGIWFAGPTELENQIYDNIFATLTMGCVVQGRHRTTNTTLKDGLQMLCGDHGGNLIDQFILADGMIREEQGLPGDPLSTANNRFLGTPDCTVTFEPYVQVGAPLGWVAIYHYFRHASIPYPELRPECVSDVNGNTIVQSTDDHYDLQPTVTQDLFNKPFHCGQGDLDALSPGEVSAELANAQAKLATYESALDAYLGEIDQGQTQDLIGYMEANPNHPSWAVRDQLLLAQPLSDTVMLNMLHHADYLDPWHITQVLVANSPLKEIIWQEIEKYEVLPAHFINILEDYDEGVSVKSLLETELALRSSEKSRSIHRLVQAMEKDSTTVGKLDSLAAIYADEPFKAGLKELYWTYLMNGRFAEAEDPESDLASDPDKSHLVLLGSRLRAVHGRWEAFGTSEVEDITSDAFEHAPHTGAISWAALLALHKLDSLPTPDLPALEKSRSAVPRHRLASSVAPPAIAVFPNPAQDLAHVTYPHEVKRGWLELVDGQGKLLSRRSLEAHPSFIELNLLDLANGLYRIRIRDGGTVIGSTNFTIAR
ncbi:MAG TPA: hypothetical protein PLB89_03020 [Flavobacteriales bacterium]|nr:hypothetical protein [Flavobacteriales bacterium]